MPYLYGLTEIGIDFDPRTKEFFLYREDAKGYEHLDKNFERVPETNPPRWRVRTAFMPRVASVIHSTMSGSATPEVIARRRLSCFGDEKTPACSELVKNARGSFCGLCKCPAWPLANLDGRVSKLSWSYLECALGRPGFSNEVKP